MYNPNASSKGTSTGAKDQATNTDSHSGRTSYSSANFNYGNSTTATHIRTTSNGYAWDATRGAADSTAWKESSNYEVVQVLLNDSWLPPLAPVTPVLPHMPASLRFECSFCAHLVDTLLILSVQVLVALRQQRPETFFVCTEPAFCCFCFWVMFIPFAF